MRLDRLTRVVVPKATPEWQTTKGRSMTCVKPLILKWTWGGSNSRPPHARFERIIKLFTKEISRAGSMILKSDSNSILPNEAGKLVL
jgi:hypothetical protein